MKQTLKLMLLFVLLTTLLLGVFTALPLMTSAADYNITIEILDEENQIIGYTDGIQIYNNNVLVPIANGRIKLTGNTFQLKATATEGYFTFVGWKDNLDDNSFLRTSSELALTLGKNTILYAVYRPVEYKIYYVGAGGVSGIPEAVQAKYPDDLVYHPEYRQPSTPTTHTFGADTLLPTELYTRPKEEVQTHTLLEWAAVDEKGNPLPISDGKIVKATYCDVYLIPKWEPKQFSVKLIDCVTEEYNEITENSRKLGEDTKEFNYGLSVSYENFDKTTVEKTYTGYEFSSATTETVNETETIVYRYFVPCKYTVTFKISAPEDQVTETGTLECTVTYNEKVEPISIPKRTGYKFLGYFNDMSAQFFDATGACKADAWKVAKDVELTARWEMQQHTITVKAVDGNGKDCISQLKITLNGEEYNPEAKHLYGKACKLEVTAPAGKKITEWNGKIAHTKQNTVSFDIGEEDIVINIVLLPTQATPQLSVNYIKETLIDFVAGSYQITTGETVWSFSVSETGVVAAISGDRKTPISLTDLFGKDLTIILLGEEGKTADSDPQQITPVARPVIETPQSVEVSVLETKKAREMTIALPTSLSKTTCEVAYTTSPEEEPANWTTDMHLADLEAGVPYTVYFRIKATETYPHSDFIVLKQEFEFKHLVDVTVLMIVLICILVLQIVALVFLLVMRKRAKLNAVAFPLFAALAIQLIPNGIFPVIVALTALVVVLQIVLVVLVVRSGVIWKQRTAKPKKQKKGEEQSVNPGAEFTLFGEPTTQNAKKKHEIPAEEKGIEDSADVEEAPVAESEQAEAPTENNNEE